MGLLDKLFGGKNKESETSTIVVDCPHAVLVPRWENVQDMGRVDKITRYMCEACHEEFEPDVANELQASINERLEASWAASSSENVDTSTDPQVSEEKK